MSQKEKPFVYICALTRTGSTVLSELLSELPYSFIFREPHLGKNTFSLKLGDTDRLKPYGIDLQVFTKYRVPFAFWLRRLRRLGYRQDFMVRSFKEKIVAPLWIQGCQVGVKEINNSGWQNYARHFPNIKVLITGRDPRDIFISTYYRHQKYPLKKYNTVAPDIFAAHLNDLFQYQLEMYKNTENLLVRYEDLCTDEQIVANLKTFVNSPLIGKPIKVGDFIGNHPLRQFEFQRHGSRLTEKSIHRWQHENDNQLLKKAQRMFDLMPAYTDFWDYEK